MPYVIDNVKVGQVIKQLLKEHKMSQDDLAKALSISKSAVSQNLNGKSTFDIQNLMSIAKLFKISLDTLLCQTEQENRDIISEYEKVVIKGVDVIKKVEPRNLNIKEPDLYGKVLIEYVIEYRKVDIFNYLDLANIELFNNFHHQAKNIYLKIINFMLEEKINDIEKYIFKYAQLYGSFNIENAEYKTAIFKQLNKSENEYLVKTLFKDKIRTNQKFTFINIKKNTKVLTKNEWIDIIATYQLNNILNLFMNYLDIYDLSLVVTKFIEKRYLEGIKIFARSNH